MFTRAADPPRINSFGFGTTTYTGITLAGACCATSTVVFTLIEVLCQDPSFSTRAISLLLNGGYTGSEIESGGEMVFMCN